MLKFYSIPNPDKLLSVVDQSQGDVFLRLPDGGECNLKQEIGRASCRERV